MISHDDKRITDNDSSGENPAAQVSDTDIKGINGGIDSSYPCSLLALDKPNSLNSSGWIQ